MNLPNIGPLTGSVAGVWERVRPYEHDDRWIVARWHSPWSFGYIRSDFDRYTDYVLLWRDGGFISYDDKLLMVPYYSAPLSIIDGRVKVNYGWMAIEPEDFVEGANANGRFTKVVFGRSALDNMYVGNGNPVVIGGNYYEFNDGNKTHFVVPMFYVPRYYQMFFDPDTAPRARTYGRY